MAGLFARLNYNYSDPNSVVSPLSSEVTRTLDSMPPLLSQWQIDDIASSNTGGYFKNPCANVTSNISNVANTLYVVTNALQGSGNLTGLWTHIRTTFGNIGNTSYLFTDHTNRISGVTSITVSAEQGTANLPHYETATQIGKALVNLMYQAEGVSNNSPIMGNFTSLFVANDLTTIYTTMSSYGDTINNSITITGTGGPGDPYVYTSNLTYITVNSIATTANTINTTFYERRTHDETFFKNCQSVMNDYKTVRAVGNGGQSENYLLQNYVGSDKLLSRL